MIVSSASVVSHVYWAAVWRFHGDRCDTMCSFFSSPCSWQRLLAPPPHLLTASAFFLALYLRRHGAATCLVFQSSLLLGFITVFVPAAAHQLLTTTHTHSGSGASRSCTAAFVTLSRALSCNVSYVTPQSLPVSGRNALSYPVLSVWALTLRLHVHLLCASDTKPSGVEAAEPLMITLQNTD